MKGVVISLSFMFFLMGNSYCQSARVTDVKIRGAKKTKTTFLTSFLETKIGDVLDSVVLDEDIKRLQRLPAISYAYYQVFLSQGELYTVFIHIEENKTLIPAINLWTTTNKQLAYKIGLYDFNFLGRSIAFGGFYQNNGYHSYGVHFRAPYLFSNAFGMAIHHQNWTSEEPLYFEKGSANYRYNNVSFEVLGMYEINGKNSMQLGVNLFKERYNFISGVESSTIPKQLSLNKTLFKFVYSYDDLTYFYQYINGFKNELYSQLVISKNAYQDKFLIAWNDFFYFTRIGEKGNWANRLRVGLSSNKKSPFAPFALDNNVNLRGVGILVDRGTGSIVCNTEYRHTLYEKKLFVLQGNLFVDAGTWRNPGGELSDFIDSKNVKVFSGIGLRFIHKKIFNAIFRIDYGYGLTKGASKGLVFGVGQYF
ncbi:MAG: POTRA domain-containing protein [Polaribacter sp.]|nr:POTRA domain-containing protein [Polaribacter sp.]